MSGQYFDAVLDHNMDPVFNGTPADTKAWLEARPSMVRMDVCVGQTMSIVTVPEYLSGRPMA